MTIVQGSRVFERNLRINHKTSKCPKRMGTMCGIVYKLASIAKHADKPFLTQKADTIEKYYNVHWDDEATTCYRDFKRSQLTEVKLATTSFLKKKLRNEWSRISFCPECQEFHKGAHMDVYAILQQSFPVIR
jgi:hypothetical protein